MQSARLSLQKMPSLIRRLPIRALRSPLPTLPRKGRTTGDVGLNRRWVSNKHWFIARNGYAGGERIHTPSFLLHSRRQPSTRQGYYSVEAALITGGNSHHPRSPRQITCG